MKRLPAVLLLLTTLPPAVAGPAPKVFAPAAPAPAPAFAPLATVFQPGALAALQGIQGVQGPAGPAGPPGLAAIPVVSVQASQYGAVGDGIHDDTAALQNALNVAVASTDLSIPARHQRLALVLPPGVYRITSPLTIDRPGGIYASVTVQGAGTSAQGATLEGGTTIVQEGVAQDSVLRIGQGAFRDITVRDLTLQMASDTAFGLHIATTQASRYHFENIIVNAPAGSHGTGVRQDEVSTTANGESPVLLNVNVYNLDTLFEGRSGQAFGWVMISCGGIKNNGGTALKFGASGAGSAGYQVTILGWSGSSLTGPLPNTFLAAGASVSGNIAVVGARDEEDDTVLSLTGSGPTACGMVSITDSHLDGMTDHGLAVDGGGNSSQWQVDFTRTKFSGTDASRVFNVRTYGGHTGLQGDNSRYNWDHCEFEYWGSVTLGVRPVVASPADPRHAGYDGTAITDCWKCIPGDATYGYKSPVTN